MSLAEEMLANIEVENEISPRISNESEEGHIVINDSRQIIVPNELKTIGVLNDKDIEMVTFDCIRYWDGHDLSEFAFYINYVLPNMKKGTYVPRTVSVDENDKSTLHFDWLIENYMTLVSGSIAFAVTAIKGGEQEGVIDYRWSSLTSTDLSIANGLDLSEVPDTDNTKTILAQLAELVEDLQRPIVNARVIQHTGNSEKDVMSQRATSFALDSGFSKLQNDISDVRNLLVVGEKVKDVIIDANEFDIKEDGDTEDGFEDFGYEVMDSEYKGEFVRFFYSHNTAGIASEDIGFSIIANGYPTLKVVIVDPPSSGEAILMNDVYNLSNYKTGDYFVVDGDQPDEESEPNTYYYYINVYSLAEKNLSDSFSLKFMIGKKGEEEILNVRLDEFVNAAIIDNEKQGEIILLKDSSNSSISNLKLYGKTTQDAEPTVDTPQELKSTGADGYIVVTIIGKNLFTSEGSKICGLAGGNGNEYNNLKRVTTDFLPIVGGYNLTISSDKYIVTNRHCYDKDKKWIAMFGEGAVLPENAAYVRLAFRKPEESDFSAEDFENFKNSNIQLELGSLSTGYENYKEPQKLTALTADGLNGVPVSSGGNYTDKNGQQWICDYIDYGKGVRVQLVGVIKNYNSEIIKGSYISTTGELTIGATIAYVLDDPVETRLNDEEIQAYKQLHTNKTNTTIYTYEGAGLAVDYIADTKTYIDNKFLTLQNAIISLGGNI